MTTKRIPNKNTAVVILAAGGSDRRWPGGDAKHLLQVLGMTIIERVIHMTRLYGHEPTVMTHRPDITAACRKLGVVVVDPEQRHAMLNTFLSARHLWKWRTVALYGDVLFWPPTLQGILKWDESPWHFWGCRAQLFGMAFTDPERTEQRTRQFMEEYPEKKMWRLIHLYQWLEGYQVGKYTPNKNHTLVGISPSRDVWTRDVDKMQEYTDLLVILKSLKDFDPWRDQ